MENNNASLLSRLRPLARAVLGVSAIAALGVFVLAAMRYQPSITHAQLVTFYLLPVAWLLAVGAIARSGDEAQVGFSFLVVSVGISLAIGEVGVTVWLDARTRASGAPEAPSVLAEILQMRASGIDVFPRMAGNQIVDLAPEIRSGSDAIHPVTPGPGSSTIRLCSEDRPTLTYASDRYGFDNPDTAWISGFGGIALVGDSYTVGVCVPASDAIPGILGRASPVLNLGMSGAGPLLELAVLREYASHVQPKTVVWIFYEGNDFYDLPREAGREWLMSYLNPLHSQRLFERFADVNAGYRFWIDSIMRAVPEEAAPRRQLTIRGVISLSAIRSILPVALPFPQSGNALGILPEVLARAKEDVAGWGGELVVVYMPAYARYWTIIGDPFPRRTQVLETLRALGIQTVDLDETFKATGDPKSLWVTPRSHLTASGYKLAAETIARSLETPSAPSR